MPGFAEVLFSYIEQTLNLIIHLSKRHKPQLLACVPRMRIEWLSQEQLDPNSWAIVGEPPDQVMTQSVHYHHRGGDITLREALPSGKQRHRQQQLGHGILGSDTHTRNHSLNHPRLFCVACGPHSLPRVYLSSSLPNLFFDVVAGVLIRLPDLPKPRLRRSFTDQLNRSTRGRSLRDLHNDFKG